VRVEVRLLQDKEATKANILKNAWNSYRPKPSRKTPWSYISRATVLRRETVFI
jgi:hypothetical protein